MPGMLAYLTGLYNVCDVHKRVIAVIENALVIIVRRIGNDVIHGTDYGKFAYLHRYDIIDQATGIRGEIIIRDSAFDEDCPVNVYV